MCLSTKVRHSTKLRKQKGKVEGGSFERALHWNRSCILSLPAFNRQQSKTSPMRLLQSDEEHAAPLSDKQINI